MKCSSSVQRFECCARLTFCSYLRHFVCHCGSAPPLPLVLSGGPVWSQAASVHCAPPVVIPHSVHSERCNLDVHTSGFIYLYMQPMHLYPFTGWDHLAPLWKRNLNHIFLDKTPYHSMPAPLLLNPSLLWLCRPQSEHFHTAETLCCKIPTRFSFAPSPLLRALSKDNAFRSSMMTWYSHDNLISVELHSVCSLQVMFTGENIPVHPHVYSNGHICLSILTEDWSPALSVQSVCLSIISMLSSCKEKVGARAAVVQLYGVRRINLWRLTVRCRLPPTTETTAWQLVLCKNV